MASIFQNEFFSAAGQKERLSNVGNTLLSAVGIKKGGVQSNTRVKVLDTALSAVASHPFITAGAAAAVVNPAGAGAVIKSAAGAVSKEFSKATLGQKTLAVVSAPVVAGALASSSKLRSAVVEAPSSLASFGGNIGAVAQNPSLKTVKELITEHPILSGVAAATGLVAVGAAGRGVAQIAATMSNTQAIKEATQSSVMSSNSPLNPTSVAGQSALVAPVTDSSVKTPIIPAPKGTLGGVKRRKKAKEPSRITQNVRVNITDDRDNIDRKVFKQRNQRG